MERSVKNVQEGEIFVDENKQHIMVGLSDRLEEPHHEIYEFICITTGTKGEWVGGDKKVKVFKDHMIPVKYLDEGDVCKTDHSNPRVVILKERDEDGNHHFENVVNGDEMVVEPSHENRKYKLLGKNNWK